jgi:predicted nicotinamide N-methyase
LSLKDPIGFIRSQTAVATPPLVPEIRLHLASEVTPLWQATEAAMDAVNLPPPYWAFAWPGGQALARYVLDRPDIIAGRRVLDFAAGCGIAGLAAMRAGAASVTAAEIDPVACVAIELNARLNDVAIHCCADDIVGGALAWDVVLAGDVCYERPMAERIIPWLRRLAATATVLLADPGRAYRPDTGLVEQARYTVPTSRDLEDKESRETVIWRLLPSA